jgi:hypothetical protein
MSHNWTVVPDVLAVHVVPLGDVRIVPFAPTATNVLLAKTTPLSTLDVPDETVSHVVCADAEYINPALHTNSNTAARKDTVSFK